MKLFLAFVSTFALVMAETIPGQGGYSGGGGGSPFPSGGGFNFGSGGYTTGGNIGGFSSGGGASSDGYSSGGVGGAGAAGGDQEAQGPQVFKYVSIHAAPEDPEDQQTKTLRVPGGNNKHVNIIFVKAPSNGADQKTEVVLPEPDEHKQLVYVLVQKTDPTANLQIRRPQPTKPAKPEVYFIRYKNPQEAAGQDAAGGYPGSGAAPGGIPSAIPSSAYGSPSPSFGAPSPAYGAP